MATHGGSAPNSENQRRNGRNPENQRPRKNRSATVDRNTLEDQCHPRKIFVGGLAHKTTTQHLRDHFGSFGTIADAVVLRWPDSRSRGFGYVTFTESDAAASVMKETHMLSGREVDVKRAVPGTNKLFVGGLPQNTTATELRELLEKYGIVSDAVVMIDPVTNRSRGFGFVCFLPGQDGSDAVSAVLAQYDTHRIRGKWIEVKSAAPPHKLLAKGDEKQQGGQHDRKPQKPNEELSLSNALQFPVQKPPTPQRPSSKSQASAAKEALAKLGSPKKVELPTEVGEPMHIPPGFTDHAAHAMGSHMAYWSSQPWLSGYGPGFGGLPTAPAGVNMNPYGANIASPDIGLSPAESFQKNLELYLRQTMDQKLATGDPWGTAKVTSTRDPSVSTRSSEGYVTHAI